MSVGNHHSSIFYYIHALIRILYIYIYISYMMLFVSHMMNIIVFVVDSLPLKDNIVLDIGVKTKIHT